MNAGDLCKQREIISCKYTNDKLSSMFDRGQNGDRV